ncbi:head GIN domain-containing protein [Novosphingopyxis sp.]|uniref:head GIN domain-containing protein n=1 Tax=Novosphingopyxis sp. TaxID=2709690 RepID=UPI003B5AA23B
MRKHLLLTPVAVFFLAISGCGYSVFDAAEDVSHMGYSDLDDGEPITAQTVEVAAFDGLGALGPDKVVFTTGQAYSIRAEAPADVLSHLRYRMKDGSIQVGRQNGSWKDKGAATIYVTAPSLRSVSAAGSGPIEADRMTGPSVDISVAGSGTVRVAEVQTDKLDASMAGSGGMILAGQAKSSDFSVAGSGDIDAGRMMTDASDVSIAGSGNVKLRSDGMVDAAIMGSGDVDVVGNARCKLSSMGSGKLHCGNPSSPS